jgi:hypothetical protein
MRRLGKNDENGRPTVPRWVHEAMKNDPKFGSLSQNALAGVLWKDCTGKTDTKVIERPPTAVAGAEAFRQEY